MHYIQLKGHSQLCDCADLDTSLPQPEIKVLPEIRFIFRSVLLDFQSLTEKSVNWLVLLAIQYLLTVKIIFIFRVVFGSFFRSTTSLEFLETPISPAVTAILSLWSSLFAVLLQRSVSHIFLFSAYLNFFKYCTFSDHFGQNLASHFDEGLNGVVAFTVNG